MGLGRLTHVAAYAGRAAQFTAKQRVHMKKAFLNLQRIRIEVGKRVYSSGMVSCLRAQL